MRHELSSVCKWSVGKMYVEMPYKTKRAHKVAKTWPISQFTPSEMGTQHAKLKTGKR